MPVLFARIQRYSLELHGIPSHRKLTVGKVYAIGLYLDNYRSFKQGRSNNDGVSVLGVRLVSERASEIRQTARPGDCLTMYLCMYRYRAKRMTRSVLHVESRLTLQQGLEKLSRPSSFFSLMNEQVLVMCLFSYLFFSSICSARNPLLTARRTCRNETHACVLFSSEQGFNLNRIMSVLKDRVYSKEGLDEVEPNGRRSSFRNSISLKRSGSARLLVSSWRGGA